MDGWITKIKRELKDDDYCCYYKKRWMDGL